MSNRKNARKLSAKEFVFVIICAIIVEVFAHVVNNTEYATDSKNTANITNNVSIANNVNTQSTIASFDLKNIPQYTSEPYVKINNNIPQFSEEDYNKKPFETYSELDSLGRCGVAYANICKEIMPEDGEKRQSISMIKPTGWKTTKYEGLVEGNYLYNRCHLIGYQLAGENANAKNLITGTRYFNVTGMLPFENMVDDYIEKYGNNHVLYRVTPIYEGNNLVASGVQMEGYSIEDKGKGVCFNVYVYNVQPGIEINYATGDSKLIK